MVGRGAVRALWKGGRLSDPLVYVTSDALKSSLSADGYTFMDADITQQLKTASRAVDAVCDRRFYPYDASNDQVRFYTPTRPLTQEVDDLLGLTTLATDQDDDGVYETTWTLHTDFELEPSNAILDRRPYERIRLSQRARTQFPVGVLNGVQVTGSFGWSSVPDGVVTLTSILAARLLQRVRGTAALGVVAMGVDGAARIVREDPDLYMLVRDYIRSPIFVG
jgi:hypothetical protein